MIKNMLRKVKWWGTKESTRLYTWFHPIEKKVLFESFAGKQYSDNPRAVSEKLHELFPDFDVVWCIENSNAKSVLPNYVRTCARSNGSFYKELATTFCFVTNEDLGSEMFKRDKQFFIQTWHGDRGCKKILYEVSNPNNKTYIADEKITDLCVAESDFGEEHYKTAFHYNGKILKCGMPRNERMLNMSDDEKLKIKENIGILSDNKIMLYAPTFRKSGEKQIGSIDIPSILDLLQKKDNKKWICLYRSHPASRGIDVRTDDKRLIDVTDYPDMCDLLAISDMLITDYSSSAYDFALTNKPVLLAIFDENDYKNNVREFKIKPEDTGLFIARSQRELEELIIQKKELDYIMAYEQTNSFFGTVSIQKPSSVICELINTEYNNRL